MKSVFISIGENAAGDSSIKEGTSAGGPTVLFLRSFLKDLDKARFIYETDAHGHVRLRSKPAEVFYRKPA